MTSNRKNADMSKHKSTTRGGGVREGEGGIVRNWGRRCKLPRMARGWGELRNGKKISRAGWESKPGGKHAKPQPFCRAVIR